MKLVLGRKARARKESQGNSSSTESQTNKGTQYSNPTKGQMLSKKQGIGTRKIAWPLLERLSRERAIAQTARIMCHLLL